ncbi:MAG: transcriptional regulator [Acidobacteria bacterium]|nr:MAG: transcriptional regulator [Acidobacteriota bacterium]
MNAVTPRERVSQLVTELGVARNRDFKRAGIHTQYVGEACNAGLIERVGRGTYALSGHIKTPQQRIAEACKRVPQGIVCLFSALWFHGLVEKEPEAIWMAIDRKAREPRVDSVPIEFVLFSGDAMTQGVVNLRVGGVPVRVYSPMKTVADCFKYADKIGTDIGPKALAAAIRGNQYNRQKLLRFAEICRVKRAVAAAENARKQPEPDRPTKEAEIV